MALAISMIKNSTQLSELSDGEEAMQNKTKTKPKKNIFKINTFAFLLVLAEYIIQFVIQSRWLLCCFFVLIAGEWYSFVQFVLLVR